MTEYSASKHVITLDKYSYIICTQPSIISLIIEENCATICIYHGEMNIGGICKIDKNGIELLKKFIQEIIQKTGNSSVNLRAKIVSVSKCTAFGPDLRDLKKILNEYNISVISADIGNASSREIVFYSDTGRLRVSVESVELDKKASDQSLTFLSTKEVSQKRKRVLMIDDSKTSLKFLSHIISQDSSIEIIGMMTDPIEAEKMIPKMKPDVITLDIMMPEMDGVTFVKRLMQSHPTPVVIVSALNKEDNENVLKALEEGAVDYIQKPTYAQVAEASVLICEKVKTAAEIDMVKFAQSLKGSNKFESRVSVLNKTNLDTSIVVAMGASTGGTIALQEILTRLPEGVPPIVIVQHIPPFFSAAFANRLNQLCKFSVKEAKSGDILKPGNAYVAPGGFQMEVEPKMNELVIQVKDVPAFNLHKPSVDVLFNSVATHIGKKAVGVILTGMGADGANGLLKMREAGARTVAQSEDGCIVFGMPRAAIERNAAEKICQLKLIPELLIKLIEKGKV
jgi:two-component system chemotaxis response regulator CheB